MHWMQGVRRPACDPYTHPCTHRCGVSQQPLQLEMESPPASMPAADTQADIVGAGTHALLHQPGLTFQQ